MNVTVCTSDGIEASYEDVTVTFDTFILQVDRDGDHITRYPLVNVICFFTEAT